MRPPTKPFAKLLVLTLTGLGACSSQEPSKPESPQPVVDQPKPAEPESRGAPPIWRQLPPDLTLVTTNVATPIPSGPIVDISTTQLMFNDTPLAALTAGTLPPEHVQRHMIRPLAEVLPAPPGGSDTMVIAADKRVPFSTLVDTLFTASRHGFWHFAFAVETAPPAARAIILNPPSAESGVLAPTFKVFIADDGYYVIDQAGQQTTLAKLDPAGTGPSAWDQAKLTAAARAAVAADPELARAMLSTENHISTDVLLSTCAVLLGPDCNQLEPTDCLLPELIIQAGAG